MVDWIQPACALQPLNLVERAIYKAQKPVQDSPRRAATATSLDRKIGPAVNSSPAMIQPKYFAQAPRVNPPPPPPYRVPRTTASSASGSPSASSSRREKELRSRHSKPRSQQSRAPVAPPTPDRKEAAAPAKEAHIAERPLPVQPQVYRGSPRPVQRPVQALAEIPKHSPVQPCTDPTIAATKAFPSGNAPLPLAVPPHSSSPVSTPPLGQTEVQMLPARQEQSIAKTNVKTPPVVQAQSSLEQRRPEIEAAPVPASASARSSARGDMQQNSASSDAQGMWRKFCASCTKGKGKGK